MNTFTHFNEQGRSQMVDISEKKETNRIAVAYSRMKMSEKAWIALKEGKVEKGDVLAVAQIAGIMAGKKTAEIIPMCHPLTLSKLNIEYEMSSIGIIEIYATVKTIGATGVEMEALTAATVTALTIYDMCKAIDKGMEIGPTYLLKKDGGKSGSYERK